MHYLCSLPGAPSGASPSAGTWVLTGSLSRPTCGDPACCTMPPSAAAGSNLLHRRGAVELRDLPRFVQDVLAGMAPATLLVLSLGGSTSRPPSAAAVVSVVLPSSYSRHAGPARRVRGPHQACLRQPLPRRIVGGSARRLPSSHAPWQLGHGDPLHARTALRAASPTLKLSPGCAALSRPRTPTTQPAVPGAGTR